MQVWLCLSMFFLGFPQCSGNCLTLIKIYYLKPLTSQDLLLESTYSGQADHTSYKLLKRILFMVVTFPWSFTVNSNSKLVFSKYLIVAVRGPITEQICPQQSRYVSKTLVISKSARWWTICCWWMSSVVLWHRRH